MGYGSCVKACQFDAIHIVDGIAKVDRSKCVGCGQCIAMCKFDAAGQGADNSSDVLNCKIAEYAKAVIKDKGKCNNRISAIVLKRLAEKGVPNHFIELAGEREQLCRKIGVMYQSGALFGSMTCLENVMLPLEEFSKLGRSERREKAMALLGDVELADAAGKMPNEISGGMRKRVAIARAMALDPEVVFLDEPSAGLDPITSSALDDLILKLREQKKMTFVVVTHELPSIFKIADRAAMFDKTRHGMVALGSPQELKMDSTDGFVRRFVNRGEEQ